MTNYEVKMVDILIKSHKRSITMLFISGVASVSIIMMNIILYRQVGHISTLSAACSGMLLWNIALCLLTLKQEHLDLRIEKEKRAFYERNDVEERERLRSIGKLVERFDNEKRA